MCFLRHHNHSSLLLKLLTPFTLTLRHVFSSSLQSPILTTRTVLKPFTSIWRHVLSSSLQVLSVLSSGNLLWYGDVFSPSLQPTRLKIARHPPPSHSYINMTGLDFLSQLIHVPVQSGSDKALKHYVLVWRVMVDIRTLIPIHYVTKCLTCRNNSSFRLQCTYKQQWL